MLDKSTLMLKHWGTDNREKVKEMLEEDKEGQYKIPIEELVKIHLPYYAPDDSLPPIPTAEDVENAQSPENRARVGTAGTVYRVNTAYAVKFSRMPMLLQEAENLLFLQDHEVRTPKVYAVFVHQGADPLGTLKRRPRPRSSLPTYYYLVMDFIDGVKLDEDMWEDLTLEARTKIYNKIGDQLRLLRSIPPPHPSYYGRVNNQAYYPLHCMISYRHRSLAGPFHTYEAFLAQAMNSFECSLIYNNIHWVPEREITPEQQLFAANFIDCFKECSEKGSMEPKLSHMDLKIENMILAPSTKNPSGKIEDYDLWIMDWETLSWMPAWAEAASTIERLPNSNTEARWFAQWQVSNGIKPFYFAQACFYHYCTHAFGGIL